MTCMSQLWCNTKIDVWTMLDYRASADIKPPQATGLSKCSSPGVGCVTATVLVMMTKDTLATAKLEAGHSTVTLLELGDIRAHFLNHPHKLMPKHVTLLHTYNVSSPMKRLMPK